MSVTERLTPTLEDNATARDLISRMTFTVPMLDLYGRELVHRFPEALPAEEVSTSDCEVGDIVYWTPRNALAIFYNKADESISDLQPVGRLDSGADGLDGCGDGDVTFTVCSE